MSSSPSDQQQPTQQTLTVKTDTATYASPLINKYKESEDHEENTFGDIPENHHVRMRSIFNHDVATLTLDEDWSDDLENEKH